MSQRIQFDVPEALIHKLGQLEEVARIALGIGESPLFDLGQKGYFTGQSSTLGDGIRSWLRPRCLELEVEICQVLGQMYEDVLELLAETDTVPEMLTTPTLAQDSERQVIAARLVELRELLQSAAPLHRALLEVGPTQA